MRAFSDPPVPAADELVCAPAVCAVSVRDAHKPAQSAQAELEHAVRKRRLFNGPDISGFEMPI
jgi:hypothetical protein